MISYELGQNRLRPERNQIIFETSGTFAMEARRTFGFGWTGQSIDKLRGREHLRGG
jgi:hypothetical protein